MAAIVQPNSVKGAVVGSPNMFGAPPNNSNRQALNHSNFIQTNDATTGTNLLSPQTVGTTVTPLVTPQNACTLTLIGATAFNIGEFADKSQFATIPANVPITIDVARQGTVWLHTGTGTSVVSFYYQTL